MSDRSSRRVVAALVAAAVALALLAACSGKRQVTNPENEQWFCQSNELGDGWECVQDNLLAQVPVPTRMPPDPDATPPGAEAPSDILAPEDAVGALPSDEDVADLSRDPREELARLQAEARAAAAPSPRAGDVQAAEADAAADAAPTAELEAPSSAAEDLETAPAAPAAPDAGGGAAAASTAIPDAAAPIPKHVRLAYVPEEPTPILELPGEYYAVQVLAMDSKDDIERFVTENGLRGMSAARVERDGELYYVLVLGVYTSYAIAAEATAGLPPPLDTAEPWIRPLASLQNAIRRADALAGNTSY